MQLKDKECPQKFSPIKFSSSFSFLFELLLLRKYTKYNLTGSKSSKRKEKYEENIIELNSPYDKSKYLFLETIGYSGLTISA